MGFKFNLQPLLNYRKRLEEEAMVAYAEAQADLTKSEQELESFSESVGQARGRCQQRASGGGEISSHLILIDDFIDGVKKKIELKKIEISEKQKIVDERHELLILASQEFKVIEKLKEKRLEEFKEEEKKAEEKFLDELAVMRFDRSGANR